MRLHVHDSGSGAAGTAVLIHGVTSSHRSWHAVEAELVGRGYRVLAPDLRGHGDSPRGGATAEFLPSFGALTGHDFLPLTAVVPSLVQVADPCTMLDEAQIELLRGRGFEIISVPETGHCIHCDDLPGFMASIKGWI